MDILLISNEDVCRSRMAQEILASFGRGLKIHTAGLTDGKRVPDVVDEVMRANGYEVSRRKSVALGDVVARPWDAVITLCKEAEEEAEQLGLKAEYMAHREYDDPLAQAGATDEELKQKIEEVFKVMYRELYELYRDELSERLLPRCSCGANTYCKCE